jgi:osmoprotectant transport system ATP-binding protein
MTIAENIGITPQLLNWPDVDISRRVAELLDLVSLPQHYATRLPDALSGGEQQRAGVARAIAARPRIVLMDEPFGALDAVTHDTLSAAYRQIHDRLGLTTIMVTHDVQEAVLRADLIAVMHAGRLLACDTPRMLLSGTADIEVNTLMAAPRRQAEQIGKLLANDSGPI